MAGFRAMATLATSTATLGAIAQLGLVRSTATLGAIAQLGALALLGLAYAKRARTLGRRRQPVPAWRRACFYGGLVTIAAALILLGGIGQELLIGHIVEHLLLGNVAALLIVLGVTGPLIEPILRVRPLGRVRVLAHPLIAFPLWTINLYAWHLPIFYEAALRHTSVQVVEHAMLIGIGVNMWMCLFGPLPAPSWFGNSAKLGYIVATWVTGALLGNIFLWSGRVFYPYYIHGDVSRHISPIADQNIAGAAMTIEESVLTLGLFWWLFLHTARQGKARREPLPSRGRAG
jgi:putative membrane protein